MPFRRIMSDDCGMRGNKFSLHCTESIVTASTYNEASIRRGRRKIQSLGASSALGVGDVA